MSKLNKFEELSKNLSDKLLNNNSIGQNLEKAIEKLSYIASEIEDINSQFKKKNADYNKIIDSLVALDVDMQYSIWWLSKSKRSLKNFIIKLEKDRILVNKAKNIKMKKFSYYELRMKKNARRIILPTLEKLELTK